jgi:hypothetical protein
MRFAAPGLCFCPSNRRHSISLAALYKMIYVGLITLFWPNKPNSAMEQTHLARSLEALAELAVNPTREINKGSLSTHQNLLTVHYDFPTPTGLC